MKVVLSTVFPSKPVFGWAKPTVPPSRISCYPASPPTRLSKPRPRTEGRGEGQTGRRWGTPVCRSFGGGDSLQFNDLHRRWIISLFLSFRTSSLVGQACVALILPERHRFKSPTPSSPIQWRRQHHVQVAMPFILCACLEGCAIISMWWESALHCFGGGGGNCRQQKKTTLKRRQEFGAGGAL